MQEHIQEWLTYTDPTTQEVIIQMQQNNPEEFQEAFFQELEFGTGGLRGIMGIGTNRMNKYTVGIATQGLANYLKKLFNTSIKVAIAYDSRNQSSEFAQIVANIFSANDIQVFMFNSLRPTPLLSFAIRELGCQSGVVITASHNPKEYNGYKAYWKDGSQLVKPHDKAVIDEVKKVRIKDINFVPQSNLISYIEKSLEEKYLRLARELSLNENLNVKYANMPIVYTPLHGTGITIVPRILQEFGFKNVHIVQEQATPDGNFPTVLYPNPEEAEALTLALQKAKEIDADLVLANDPDADRVGVAVKDLQDNFVLLNGNQTGALLMYYLLTMWQKRGKLQGNEYIVKTIVTSELIDAIAEKFGVKCYNTYTGFKYIASIIRENENKATFIAGCEESYGYLIGDFVRDKDGVSACALIAEMTAYAKEHFGSLYGMLLHIYKEFGYYEDVLVSVTKKGIAGMKAIEEMMKNFRENPPKKLADSNVIKIKDYQALTETNLLLKSQENLPFSESSNVLQFFTTDGTKVSVRPSGTEPKIKFYFNLKTNYSEDLPSLQKVLQAKVQTIRQELKL